VIARWLPPAFQRGIDIDAVDSAADIPYDIPNLRVEYVREEPPAVPTGFWRGVGPNNNIFAIESFIDELAKKAGKDPVAFRREMLGKAPRLAAALDLAASKAGWGNPLPVRTGRGVEVQISFGSFIATVAEVEVDEAGEVSVRRIVTAVDTGIVVNPDTVIAQLQGGLLFGLTAALYGEITIDKRPRAAEQFQRLPHAAHRPDARHRGAHHQKWRSTGWPRRGRHQCRAARDLQRALRRDRRPATAPAD